MCIIWHFANILLYLWGGDRVLLLQYKKDACRPIALHQLLGGTTGHGELMLTTDLGFSLLCVSKALFHPALDCIVFP